MNIVINRPLDPYSPHWPAYWLENPDLLRAVGAGAAAADVDPDPDPEPDPAPDADPEPDPKPDKAALDAAINDEDWRNGLPEDLKKTADRFASREDALRAIESFRKRESQVRVPDKDASKEDIAAYHKAVGVPENAESYEFPALAEGQELTDEMKASRAQWGQRFLDLNISNDAAKALTAMVAEDSAKLLAAQVETDKAFAAEQEEVLRAEWKGEDFEKNKTLANRAFSEIANRAGLNLDDLTKIETKDGRFLMDNASMLRLFSVIGREMDEGALGPLSEGERDSVEDAIAEVRTQGQAANDKGDTKLANKLYQKELALIAKLGGDKGIVGAGGRTV